ncbi:alpha/beta hydrolase fold domain-containing protein [Streptomyces sp. NPDC002785]|uniref:alpha/beta hydrolase n=1 Tax=Streptomyces sp. NPDC002785 TaxID=3154543 RepID=UPI0033212A2A
MAALPRERLRRPLPAVRRARTREDLGGLAPAYLLVAGLDPLRDEGIDYARRLLRDGVPVELHHFPGGFHTIDVAAPTATFSRRALADQAAALRSALLRVR